MCMPYEYHAKVKEVVGQHKSNRKILIDKGLIKLTYKEAGLTV